MTIYKFALVAGNDVFSIMSINSEDPNPIVPRLIAGMQSNPITLDVTNDNPDINVGWTWDGECFIPPLEDIGE